MKTTERVASAVPPRGVLNSTPWFTTGASHVIPSSEYENATPRWGWPLDTPVYNPVSPIAINRRKGLKTFAPHPCQFRPLVEYATVFVPRPVAIHRRAPHVIPRPHIENTEFPSPCHVAVADTVAVASVKYASVFTVPRPVAMKFRPFHATPCAYKSNPVLSAPLSGTPVHVFPSIE